MNHQHITTHSVHTSHSRYWLWMVVVIAAMSLSSCSLKKNTASTRQYTAFITRYNIYFNGDEHYKTTLGEMEKSYEDDYSQLLFVHPADAKSNPYAPQPSGDFTRSIEKAQKAIQLRSIKKRPARKAGKSSNPEYRKWLKRDEYNPFLHNAWLMMGRSQYNNGDYLGAAATFYYITRHFTWLPRTVLEAKLWQARCYTAMGWDYEAENILSKISKDALTTKTLQRLYDIVYASFYVRSSEPGKAIPYLEQARRHGSASQKSRLNFLLGQLYERAGEKSKAYAAFKKSASPWVSYRTRLNARIKQSEVFTGNNIEKEVKALRRMTRYDANQEYLDQIYYAIGNLYLSRRDTTHAIDNYRLATEKSTRGGIDKAIAQLALGKIYFDRRQYSLAQPCYSEAVPVLPANYPGYDSLKRRSDVLDELAIYAQNVELNDSLLKLADMTPEQRLEVIKKIIDELNKKEKEEKEQAALAEARANQQAQGNVNNLNGNANAPTTFTMNTDNSWYFYNTATRNAGKTEFQRRWGSRRLEDDWRRHNKQTFSFSDFDSDNDDDTDGDSDHTDTDDNQATGEQNDSISHASDPHFAEYYLQQIPTTPEQRQTANDVIQEGLYNEGLILKDKLEAYSDAAHQWNTLLDRYPDNIYRLDVYYNMYMMYMRSGNEAMAEHYRALILKDFPDSPYGQAMTDPKFLEKMRDMNRRQEEMYTRAYNAYLNNHNDSVHMAYKTMTETYPLSKIMPKFMFIDALTYVTENNPTAFRDRLKELLERYPDTDITPLASAYLKGLGQGRQLHRGASNVRSMIWDLRLSNDSTVIEGDSVTFDLNPADRQMLVLVYPTDEVSANQLLFDVARHNFSSFVVKDFDLEQMNFGRLGLLLIKGFASFEELAHYRSVMKDSPYLQLPPQVRPIMISEKNFDTLLQHGKTFDDYFRWVDSQAAEAPVTAAPGSLDNPDIDPAAYSEAIMNDIPDSDVTPDDDSTDDTVPTENESDDNDEQ